MKRWTAVVLIFCVIAGLAACAAKTPPQSGGDALTEEEKQAALEEVYHQLTKVHPRPYAHTSEKTLGEKREEVAARLPKLDRWGTALAIQEMAALLGDGHTSVSAGTAGHYLPFWLREVEGQYVLWAAEDEELRGKVLVAINGVAAEELAQRLRPVISYENEPWMRQCAGEDIGIMEYLRYAGAAQRLDGAQVAWRDPVNGEEGEQWVEAQANINVNAVPMEALRQHGRVPTLMRWASDDRRFYHVDALADGTVYVQYNECAEQPEYSVQQLAEDTAAAVESGGRLVIDLRYNSGGDNQAFYPMRVLVKALVGQGTEVYGLIGTGTFSSAVWNAYDLRQAGATLVGEPTGGCVSSPGNCAALALPGGLSLWMAKQYRTYYAAMGDAGQADPLDGKPLLPDVTVRQTLADYIAGRDTVLEAVLSGLD